MASISQTTLNRKPTQPCVISKHKYVFGSVDSAIQRGITSACSTKLSLHIYKLLFTLLTASPTKAETNYMVSVGPHLLPIPQKLAEKIWCNRFELHELLSARLGIPQPTLIDVLTSTSIQKAPLKQISTIEEWVKYINAYTALITVKQPERIIKDLLTYSSIFVNASNQFECTLGLNTTHVSIEKEEGVQPGK